MASISMLFLLLLLGLALNKAFSYHCDFEEGTCGWQNKPGNPAGCGWSLRKGLAVTPNSGPFADHTYGTSNGTYLYFQSSYCSPTYDNSVGVVLPIKGFNQDSICVKFWYLMYGNGDQYVLGLQKDEYIANQAFISQAGSGRSWKFAQVSVNQSSHPYSLRFYAFGGMPYADVALDDIDITDGQCGAAMNLCDFERGDLCGFNVTKSTGDFQWSNVIAAMKLPPLWSLGDHTLSSSAGHVAFAYSEEGKKGITSMVSPVQESPETEQCLTFFFFFVDLEPSANADNESAPTLSMYILTDRRGKVTPAWSVAGGNLIFWEYATVPISLKEPYQYSFVASKGTTDVFFLVDDISVRDGPCSPRLTCTFNNGSFCNWINPWQHSSSDLPQLAWMADEPYPEIWTDAPNITGSFESEGGYIFLDAKYLGPNPALDGGFISSQRFPLKINGSWCFSFTYRLLLEGDAQAALSVQQWVEPNAHSYTLFSTSNSTADQWVNQKVDIKSRGAKNFFLAVAGFVYPTARICRIELDNFELSDHACSA